MTTMTLRGIDEPLAQALKDLARNQGVSLNTLALRLIREATGVVTCLVADLILTGVNISVFKKCTIFRIFS